MRAQYKNPIRRHTLAFSCHTSPFPLDFRHSETFLAGALSFKPDDAHLTLSIALYVLHPLKPDDAHLTFDMVPYVLHPLKRDDAHLTFNMVSYVLHPASCPALRPDPLSRVCADPPPP